MPPATAPITSPAPPTPSPTKPSVFWSELRGAGSGATGGGATTTRGRGATGGGGATGNGGGATRGGSGAPSVSVTVSTLRSATLTLVSTGARLALWARTTCSPGSTGWLTPSTARRTGAPS